MGNGQGRGKRGEQTKACHLRRRRRKGEGLRPALRAPLARRHRGGRQEGVRRGMRPGRLNDD